jgi:hypothetical protein
VGVITSAIVIGFTMLLLDKAHTTFRPSDHGDLKLAAAENAKMLAAADSPDGKAYRIHYQQDDTDTLTRGRYLVADDGTIHFDMIASVDPAYPYKLAESDADVKGKTVPLLERKEFSKVKLEVPAGAATREGLDGEPYSVVMVSGSAGAAVADDKAPPGEYLVDKDGKIAFTTNVSSELGLDRKSYKVVETETTIGGVAAGRYLVDEAGAIVYTAHENWKFDAPKAQLFRLIIDGTLGGKLPWDLVLIGALLAIMLELVGVSSLPFAVGLYLPIYTSAGIFVGGIVRWLVDRRTKTSAADAEFSPGVLMASGLIAGGAIAGVVQSVIAFNEWEGSLDLSKRVPELLHNETWWPMIPFLGMAAFLYYTGTKKTEG